MKTDSIKILQLTDFHLFGDKHQKLVGINPYATLKKVMELVEQELLYEKPDLVMLTGDLSQDNSEKSYIHLKEFIENIKAPITATMGNHDNPAAFHKILGDKFENFFIMNKWRIVLLNSHWPGHVPGLLDKEQIKFFENSVTNKNDLWTMIVLHHHVQPIASLWLDNLALKNSSTFFEIAKKCQHLKVVLCGHVHQEGSIRYDQIDFISTPATSWQFATYSPNFKLDSLMPGYRWIELFDDGTYTTRVERVPFDPEFVPNLDSQGY